MKRQEVFLEHNKLHLPISQLALHKNHDYSSIYKAILSQVTSLSTEYAFSIILRTIKSLSQTLF